MNVNYDSVCRLCLSSRCELLPIFSTTSSDDSEPLVLASKIKDCVAVQINQNDNLPTNVCKKCMNNVNNWHIFKGVCTRAQDKLQSLIDKESNQLEEVKIKSEPLNEEVYDDGVVIDGSYPDNENAGTSTKIQLEGPPILASLGLTPRSDKKYVDPRMDWQRVHAILDMVQDDEVIDSLQSTEESDIVHNSDHNSDTDVEFCNDLKDEYLDCKSGYLCRNKRMLSKNPKLSSSANITKIKKLINLRKRKFTLPKHYSLPKDAWKLLITDDLLDLIVSSTNEQIGNTKKKPILTNVSEIKTLIGILYYHGISRPTYQKISDLWHKEFGAPCIQNAMNFERFKYLLENIRFDTENSVDLIDLDVMKRIRKVFEIFALNCRTCFETGNTLVVDEIILPVKGPCPFKYNITKRELKSGIKIVLVVDPDNFFVSNLDVITDPYFGSDEIVMKLCQHFAGTWRTVIMDSWFSSLILMDRLKKEYQLFSIAAINENDDILPPIFVSEYRKSRQFITGFLNEDVSLTSCMTEDSKTVNILTNEPNFYKRGHVDHRTVVSQYKKNQSAVEVLDVVMHYYTTMQHTNDWTLSLFFIILNIASINAQVIWSSQNASQKVVQRRLFIKELAVNLIEKDLHPNLLLEGLSGLKKSRLSSIQTPTKFNSNRKRCRICILSTRRDRRTKQFCHRCGTFICREHTINVCTTCGSGG